MAMEIYGREPKTLISQYFASSWWCWRPLAEYIQSVAPEIAGHCHAWYYNDGDGLNATDSIALAGLLDAELSSGRCRQYATEREAVIDTLPPIDCHFCRGTGKPQNDGRTRCSVRRLGVEISDTIPFCVMCGGHGKWKAAEFAFHVEAVRWFAAFLRGCGGFSIR
ncbi:MAG: hypothetical protein PHR35_21720 [Kiritimatiellae bacterium]|nr:hypothetical protein [Kiritimatiellia bacterium]